jgi:hypothetical protein
MKRRGAWAAGIGLVVAVLLAAAAGSSDVEIVRNAPELPWEDATITIPYVPPESVPEEAAARTEPPPEVEQPLFITVLLVVVWIVLAIGVSAALVLFTLDRITDWRARRSQHGWRPPAGEVEDAPTDDDVVLEAVAAGAEEQRQALLVGAPRNAIVECWLRLEADVASAGVPTWQSDTSSELTERALSNLSVDPDAIRDLAALYREARFSQHPMGEDERAIAVRALDAVHAGLRARTSA